MRRRLVRCLWTAVAVVVPRGTCFLLLSRSPTKTTTAPSLTATTRQRRREEQADLPFSVLRAESSSSSSPPGGSSSSGDNALDLLGTTEELPKIRWLPPLDPKRRTADPSGAPGATVLPLFPLGSVAYTPGSQQVLNVFEPRYREMYSDILMSRRFVTTMVNPDKNAELAEVGVVLYLEDLKEVSQQTNDAIKYVCSHKVLDQRVTILGVLNPKAAETRDTYMRVEVADVVDADAPDEAQSPSGTTGAFFSSSSSSSTTTKDAASETAALEKRVATALSEIAEMQEASQEDVRFSRNAVSRVSAGRGVGDGTLWGVVELWKNFLDARAQAASRKVQGEVQARLVKFLSERAAKDATGKGKASLPTSVNLSDLPADLQRDVKTLRERVLDDVAPLIDEQTTGIQRLLQSDSHLDRLKLFLRAVEAEKRRLIARQTLKATFAGLNLGGGSSSSSSSTASAPGGGKDAGIDRSKADDANTSDGVDDDDTP